MKILGKLCEYSFIYVCMYVWYICIFNPLTYLSIGIIFNTCYLSSEKCARVMEASCNINFKLYCSCVCVYYLFFFFLLLRFFPFNGFNSSSISSPNTSAPMSVYTESNITYTKHSINGYITHIRTCWVIKILFICVTWRRHNYTIEYEYWNTGSYNILLRTVGLFASLLSLSNTFNASSIVIESPSPSTIRPCVAVSAACFFCWMDQTISSS